jgi:hypothetical protein
MSQRAKGRSGNASDLCLEGNRFEHQLTHRLEEITDERGGKGKGKAIPLQAWTGL